MGGRVVKAGDGFFVRAGRPYSYTAGPDGVEVLELHAAATSFDMRIFDLTVEKWAPIVQAAEEHQHEWRATWAARGQQAGRRPRRCTRPRFGARGRRRRGRRRARRAASRRTRTAPPRCHEPSRRSTSAQRRASRRPGRGGKAVPMLPITAIPSDEAELVAGLGDGRCRPGRLSGAAPTIRSVPNVTVGEMPSESTTDPATRTARSDPRVPIVINEPATSRVSDVDHQGSFALGGLGGRAEIP